MSQLAALCFGCTVLSCFIVINPVFSVSQLCAVLLEVEVEAALHFSPLSTTFTVLCSTALYF